jgi:transposase-like protein
VGLYQEIFSIASLRSSREVYRRLKGEVKRKSSTWHMDEVFVRVAGR